MRGSGAARNGTSRSDLVELDLVAKGVEDVRAPPTRYGVGLLESGAGGAEPFHGVVEVVDAKRKVPPRVETQVVVLRKMHVSGTRCVPDARSRAKRRWSLDLLEAKRGGVELPSSGFLARGVEDLRVVQRRSHPTESRRRKCAVFRTIRGLSCARRNRRCVLAIEQQNPSTTDMPVVSLTARATDKLREIISKQDRENLALRVYVTPGGCSGFSYGMTFADGTEDDDTVVESDGVRVVVDPMSAMYIKGSEIDFVDALMGGGFALRNPNAVSSCGCGQSFKTAEQSGTAKACHH